MGSVGLALLVGSLAISGLLISYRLATIAMRVMRWRLLKRTSMVLPAVRPPLRSPFVPVTARHTIPLAPRAVMVVQSTLPPVHSSAAVRRNPQTTHR